MEPQGTPSPPLPRWNLALLAGLALFFLLPVLRTGYLSDDAQQSLLPGMLKVEGYSLAEGIHLETQAYIPAGRFMPLHFAYMYSMFRATNGLFAYKAYIVAVMLLDLVLFFLLVRRVAKNEAFATFATCLVLASLQVCAFLRPDALLLRDVAARGRGRFIVPPLPPDLSGNGPSEVAVRSASSPTSP